MGFAVRADVIGLSATAAVFVVAMLAALVAGRGASAPSALSCRSRAKKAAARTDNCAADRSDNPWHELFDTTAADKWTTLHRASESNRRDLT
jgi:hypothetical protein